ncbi:glycosyltransferase [Agreia sp. Leaf335]|uniref:glycosyltransferase n=1 Tax=Agreia sp. Leaf335 TaxID=1736340 RepID=UPI0009EA402D|nr:glycosyltransferase [Agreia sp. Leaf335]
MTSDRWADPKVGSPVDIDVLIPTVGRPAELAVTLAGLAAQDDPPFRVIISDQSDDAIGTAHPAVEAMVRVLRAQGRTVEVHRHLPRRGLAEQRQYLFDCSSAPAVLYLDDDVWLEPGQLETMSSALDTLGCGFVGEAVQGLSYLDDERPEQQSGFELWSAKVEPERVRRGLPAFDRWPLHNAANLTHIARRIPLSSHGWAAYKVASVGGCVLYSRHVLEEAGAFRFWSDLPAQHSGLTGLTVLSTPHPAALARSLVTSAQALRSFYMLVFQLPWIPERLLRRRLTSLLERMGLTSSVAASYGSFMSEPRRLTGGLNWYRGIALPDKRASPNSTVLVPTTYIWGNGDQALGRRAAELTRPFIAARYRFVELAENHWLPENAPDVVAREIIAGATSR